MDWMEIVGFVAQVIVTLEVAAVACWNLRHRKWNAKIAVVSIVSWLLCLLALQVADNRLPLDPADELKFRMPLLAIGTTVLSVLVLLSHGGRVFTAATLLSLLFSLAVTWRLGLWSRMGQPWGVPILWSTLLALWCFGLFFCAILAEPAADACQAWNKRRQRQIGH